MTSDQIGGKQLSHLDARMLKALAGGCYIRGTRIFPYPMHFEMLGENAVRIAETDVERLAGRGWVAVDGDAFGDVCTYTITQAGRDVLETRVVREPVEQPRLL